MEIKEMQDDNQLKHFVWWVIKTTGNLPDTYAEYMSYPLSDDVCRDIEELTNYINNKND